MDDFTARRLLNRMCTRRLLTRQSVEGFLNRVDERTDGASVAEDWDRVLEKYDVPAFLARLSIMTNHMIDRHVEKLHDREKAVTD